jgi:hypothetical protein
MLLLSRPYVPRLRPSHSYSDNSHNPHSKQSYLLFDTWLIATVPLCLTIDVKDIDCIQ